MESKNETNDSKPLPKRFIPPTVLKFSLGQVSAIGIPYLLVASLCYVSGFWSNLSIDVFNYFQVQDILKTLANPLLGFVGFTLYPLLTVVTVLSSWHERRDSTKAKWIEFEGNEAWYEKIGLALVTIALGLLFTVIVLLILVGSILLFSLLLTPVERLAPFGLVYLRTLGLLDWLRLPLIIFICPAIVAVLVKNHVQGTITQIGSLIGSITIPLLIAYHFGRMESFKILSGLEFRYVQGPAGPMKYLGKADTYYFFSEDKGYVPYRKSVFAPLSAKAHDQTIRIVSTDSLKQVRLLYYSSTEQAQKAPAGFIRR